MSERASGGKTSFSSSESVMSKQRFICFARNRLPFIRPQQTPVPGSLWRLVHARTPPQPPNPPPEGVSAALESRRRAPRDSIQDYQKNQSRNVINATPSRGFDLPPLKPGQEQAPPSSFLACPRTRLVIS
jgi:hypothetical protein